MAPDLKRRAHESRLAYFQRIRAEMIEERDASTKPSWRAFLDGEIAGCDKEIAYEQTRAAMGLRP